MSYDLEIFNGNPDEPEDTFAPLDSRLAWRVLDESLPVEDTARDHDELVWYLPTFTVDFFLGHAEDAVQSMGAAILWGNRSDPDFAAVMPDPQDEAYRAQQRSDLARIFIILQTMAEKLGAQVYDPQHGVFTSRADMDAFVAQFADDAVMQMTMTDAAAYPLTDDEDEKITIAEAVQFSPWTVLIILVVLGLMGYYFIGGDDEPANARSATPVANSLTQYQPASRRNAVPTASVWVDDAYTVHRSPVKNDYGIKGLVWVIKADGKLVTERPADNEMSFRMGNLREGVTYSVQLKLYDGSHDGAGRVISELLTFTRRPVER